MAHDALTFHYQTAPTGKLSESYSDIHSNPGDSSTSKARRTPAHSTHDIECQSQCDADHSSQLAETVSDLRVSPLAAGQIFSHGSSQTPVSDRESVVNPQSLVSKPGIPNAHPAHSGGKDQQVGQTIVDPEESMRQKPNDPRSQPVLIKPPSAAHLPPVDSSLSDSCKKFTEAGRAVGGSEAKPVIYTWKTNDTARLWSAQATRTFSSVYS